MMHKKSLKRMVEKLYQVAAFPSVDTEPDNEEVSRLYELEFIRRTLIAAIEEMPYQAKTQDELIETFFAQPLDHRNIRALLDAHEELLIKGVMND